MEFLKKLIVTFTLLIVFYIVSLTSVFCLPAENIEKNALKDINILVLEESGHFRFNRDIKLLCEGPASYIDALTDATMLTRNINLNKTSTKETDTIQKFFSLPLNFVDTIYSNPFKAALSMNGYGRYWQGYEILLRPLLMMFDYIQIRWLNMLWFGFCASYVSYLFYININKALSGIFILGLCLCKFPLIPLSMQFMNLFMLMLMALIALEYRLKKTTSSIIAGIHDEVYLWSFLIGSLTAFFDFLTTPVLPWGMCIIYLMLYMWKNKQFVFSNLFVIYSFVLWGIGYFATWAAKWGIYSILIDSSMLIEVYNQIILRLNGIVPLSDGTTMAASPKLALLLNILILFKPFVYLALFFFVFVILLPLLIHKYPLKNRSVRLEKQLLLVAIIPCLWYLLLANHSQIHYWYTYRSLLVSFMAIFGYAIFTVDWNLIFKFSDKKILK